MDKKFTLKNIFFALYRSIWVIVVLALLGGIIGFSYSSFFITPSYSSKATFVVMSSSSGAQNSSSSDSDGYSISTGDQNSAAQLINTYEKILTSTAVCKNISSYVKTFSGLDYSAGQIKKMVSIAQVGNSQIMKVTVTCNNYDDACIIANAYYTNAETEVHTYFKGGDITPLDMATVNKSRIAPSRTLYTIVGAMICGIVSIIVIVIIALLDKRIKTEEDIVNLCNIPIIGTIPHTEH